MREGLAIALWPRGGAVRVAAAGKLDREGSPRLATYLEIVAETFKGPLELDLRGVSAVDGDGVRLLVGLQRTFRRRLRIIPSEAVAHTVHVAARPARSRTGVPHAVREPARR